MPLISIDLTPVVKDFITSVDAEVNDLSWDVKVWIQGYTQFHKQSYTQEDLIEYYERHVPITAAGKLCGRTLHALRHDVRVMIDQVTKQLWPDMHRYLAETEDTPPPRFTVSLHATDPIRCTVVINE